MLGRKEREGRLEDPKAEVITNLSEKHMQKMKMKKKRSTRHSDNSCKLKFKERSRKRNNVQITPLFIDFPKPKEQKFVLSTPLDSFSSKDVQHSIFETTRTTNR